MSSSELRDIGERNPFSMKDGVIFRHKSQVYLFTAFFFLQSYNYYYRTTPRKFKVHRSVHNFVLLGLSIYLPYRYDAQVNTILFSLTKSSNPLLNRLVRIPTKLLVYGTSILAGQVVGRLYWTYKRCYNASSQATFQSYLIYKTYADDKERYPYMQAF